MEFLNLAFALTIGSLLTAAMDFVPVLNVVKDVVGAVQGTVEPSWWGFAIKAAWTVTCLQIAMPYLEKFTRSTANTWDDGLLQKLKMIVAFAVEILGAIGAFDPKLGSRLRAITGPRD